MKRPTPTHLAPRIIPRTRAHTAAATDPDQPPRRPLRRRFKSPSWGRRAASGCGGRRSGPTTPLLRWKFDEAEEAVEKPVEEEERGGAGEKTRRKTRNAAAVALPVSARKLAAGIWQLQLREVSGAARRVAGTVGFEPVLGHLQPPQLCNLKGTDHHKDTNNECSSPVSVCSSKRGFSYKLETSFALPNPAMERATKWDPGLSKASDEVYRLYSQLKFLEDQQATAVSVVSSLRTDLEQARARINELEDERRSSKKKLDHFLRKLAEEKASWRSREHEKIRAIIDDMKGDLNRERKNRQRMEIVNSKLVSDLKEAKLSAKRYLQDYEKERKARELMEEVCDELAKEIGEEKAEVEALKRESMKIREEVEEERRMLQMAEVWREERVQMKLIDAKVTLEEKYMQIVKLQADLEAFLRSHGGANLNVAEVREAEMLMQAVNSVKVDEIKEFSYEPHRASEDIFAVFEELQPAEDTNEREIEQCYAYSPASRASKIHTVSPEINGFIGIPVKRYADGSVDDNEEIEDESGWETMSPGEEQGSSNSPDGSDPSVNGACLESNASVSATDWEVNTENGKLNNEIMEVCSAITKQSKKKASSIARFWKSSCPNNGEDYKIVTVDGSNGRLSNAKLSNGRLSNATISPDRGCGNVGLSSPSIGQWSSPDSVNPHITRGMKGCIEWPKGMQKQSLKAKLLEARMESQKIQLRQVLKQKS